MSVPTLQVTESGKVLLAFIIAFTVVVTLIVGLRFYAALALAKRRIRIDDWLILLAWLSTVTSTSLTIGVIPHGVGVQMGELPSDQIGIQFKNMVIVGITWLIATYSIRASILCFYKVIFTANGRSFNIKLYTLLGVCAGLLVTYLCIAVTECIPIDYQWNPQPGGYCRDMFVQQISGICVDIALDLCIMILPLPILWRLQTGLKNKLIITFLLGIGIINTAIMLWLLVVIIKTRSQPDFTYGLGTVLIVPDIEIWVGIIAACVPTLTPLWAAWIRPLVNAVVSGVWSRSGNSNGGVTEGSSNWSRPTLVTFGGSGGNQNSRRHATKGGADDTLTTTKDGYFGLEDGYMLRGEKNTHVVNVRGGGSADGEESSIGGSSGNFKEQRRLQDIQMRQEVLVTDTMGQKAYNHV